MNSIKVFVDGQLELFKIVGCCSCQLFKIVGKKRDKVTKKQGLKGKTRKERCDMEVIGDYEIPDSWTAKGMNWTLPIRRTPTT